MVFLIDDILEGTTIAGILTSIASMIFSTAPELAETATITGELGEVAVNDSTIADFAANAINTNPIFDTTESKLVLNDLLEEDGLQGVMEINQGSVNNTTIPEYNEYYDKFDEYIRNNKPPSMDENSFKNSLAKIANSISSKIPKDSDGFKKLVIDIVEGAKKNPKHVLGAAIATVGTVGVAKGVYDRIKAAYNSGSHLPKDLKKTLKDTATSGTKVISDVKNDVDDLINMLPGSLEQS